MNLCTSSLREGCWFSIALLIPRCEPHWISKSVIWGSPFQCRPQGLWCPLWSLNLFSVWSCTLVISLPLRGPGIGGRSSGKNHLSAPFVCPIWIWPFFLLSLFFPPFFLPSLWRIYSASLQVFLKRRLFYVYL